VTLARAEDEVSREIVLRLPVAEKTVTDLQMAARAREDEQSIEARGPEPSYIIPASAVGSSGSFDQDLLAR